MRRRQVIAKAVAGVVISAVAAVAIGAVVVAEPVTLPERADLQSLPRGRPRAATRTRIMSLELVLVVSQRAATAGLS